MAWADLFLILKPYKEIIELVFVIILIFLIFSIILKDLKRHLLKKAQIKNLLSITLSFLILNLMGEKTNEKN
jgi:hypothetical protein